MCLSEMAAAKLILYLAIFLTGNEKAREADLPKISVSANRTVKHNSWVEIACNLTEEKKTTTSLKWISWYNNGQLFERVRSPDPDKPGGSLTPLRLPSVGVREAGVYTCLLEVLLQKERDYNISESMELRIAPWLTPPNEDIEVKSFKDETAQFNCSAKGNPLEVEWKVQTKGKDEVQACIRKYLDVSSSCTRTL
ncbi:uncharacterized protein [Montipora foliosa]|uniref:uncharacterized protein n=1 Tax=Montipora foliosa TaxID=591990 RepID=UPI0035F218D9